MSDSYSLYIVRHAVAEARGDAYPDDDLRPLSAKGIAKFEKVARSLADFGLSVDRILSSPLVRARQTADILAQRLRNHPDVVETKALAPGGTYRDLTVELESCTKLSSIALVGHEPSIGELAARLIGLRTPIEFKKGAVCRVDVDTLPPAGPGQLRWFATAKMLSKLGK